MTETFHVREELCALIDGELPEAERQRVELHLRQCPSCASERDLLAAAMGLVAQSPAIEPSAALRRGVLNALDAQPPGLLHRLRSWLAPRYLVPAGALAAAAVVFAVADHQGAPPHPNPEEIALAERLDLLEDLDVLTEVPSDIDPADLEVVAHLHELGE